MIQSFLWNTEIKINLYIVGSQIGWHDYCLPSVTPLQLSCPLRHNILYYKDNPPPPHTKATVAGSNAVSHEIKYAALG
jgi:hypothetical protein